MSEAPQAGGGAPLLARRMDQACNRFEEAWRDGARAPIEDFLDGWHGPERSVLLRELVMLEVYYRRGRGEECRPQEYRDRFPELDPEWVGGAVAAHAGPSLVGTTPDARIDSSQRPPREKAGGEPAVPGYEIQGVLGKGGMGVVYRARQVRLDRVVALKMIRAGAHADAEELARFKAEAEAAARLQHPHIVQVHDVGEAEGRPFLSMEYVDGGSLAQKLAGTPLPPPEAARLIETLARAVHHAHRRGIVHRDLKPANILLSRTEDRGSKERGVLGPRSSVPKITDFSLAKRLEGSPGMTQTGAVMGTPSYMAPEQAAGQARAAGPLADVYALGAILYECLTGRPPFRAATVLDTLEQVRSLEPVPPRWLQPKVPRDLETICLKCLAKAPEQRYPTASGLAEDLRRWLNGEPIQARPVSRWERGWRWARRRPATAALILVSAVAVVALGGIITGSFFYARLQKEVERAEMYQYFHHTGVAHAEWRDGSVARVEPLLDACPPHRRHWEWRYLKGLCHQDLLTLRGHTKAIRDLAINPEGTRLASAGWDHAVRVWDATTGDCLLALNHTHQVWGVAFSPDGAWIAAGSWDGIVKVWDATTGREAFTLQAHEKGAGGAADHAAYGVAFSPDGNRLATAGGDWTVKVWDARAPRDALLTLSGHKQLVLRVAFSPDGKQLASASNDQTVKLWDAETGRLIHTFQEHTGGATSVAFSPDGTRLASSAWDSTVKVWDARVPQEALLTLRGHTGAVMGVQFGPDGRWLASAGGDGAVRVWDARTGQQTLAIKGHTGGVMSAVFSPNGRRIASASADGTVKVWDAFASQEARTFTNPATHRVLCLALSPNGASLALGSGNGSVTIVDATTWQKAFAFPTQEREVRGVAFSPDGKRLASSGQDKLVKLWDAATGELIHTLTGHTDWVRGVAFSPDGKRLASSSFDLTIRVWDLTTGKGCLVLKGHTDRVWRVAYSPDGGRLASTSRDRTVRVWDAATGQEIHKLTGHNFQVVGAAFSPDGKRLASASQDHTVMLWDTTTGHLALTLKGHTGMGWGVAFSPDGNQLTSVSDDGTLKVWDAAPLPQSP